MQSRLVIKLWANDVVFVLLKCLFSEDKRWGMLLIQLWLEAQNFWFVFRFILLFLCVTHQVSFFFLFTLIVHASYDFTVTTQAQPCKSLYSSFCRRARAAYPMTFSLSVAQKMLLPRSLWLRHILTILSESQRPSRHQKNLEEQFLAQGCPLTSVQNSHSTVKWIALWFFTFRQFDQ